MERLTFRNSRRIVFILMLIGLAALLLAAYALEIGSGLRTAVIWFGVLMYVASLILMWTGFKCPKCGSRFFKSAMFISMCPICGQKFADFEEKTQEIEGTEFTQSNK
jgi:hypothetical protein